MSAGSRSRSRVVFSSACSALALLAAGCGSGESEPARPLLPEQVGSALAARTDAVADALEAGDVERARAEADRLRQAVTRAVDAGRVPAELQEPLSSAVNELLASIPTPSPPPPPPPPPPVVSEEDGKEEEKEDKGKEDKGKDEGKGKEKDDGKKDDD